MQKPTQKPPPTKDSQPSEPLTSEKLRPDQVDFAERNDDPAQARELERQQDA